MIPPRERNRWVALFRVQRVTWFVAAFPPLPYFTIFTNCVQTLGEEKRKERNPTPPSPEIQTALDLMHVVSKHRILRQHPVAVVASRFPTALFAVEKKKANKTSPRIHPRVLSHHLLCAQGTKPELHQRYPFEI